MRLCSETHSVSVWLRLEGRHPSTDADEIDRSWEQGTSIKRCKALNPGDGNVEVERFGWTFRVGDRVIQTENSYSRDAFNGDLGIVAKIDRAEQAVIVDMEGRMVDYDFGDLDELALAYALSIHKSQGSEFPCVVIPLHTQHYLMLQRNVLYITMTRGKKLVVLVGSKKALRMAVGRKEAGRRYTALRARLIAALA